VVVIYAGTRGHLDEVAMDAINRFEAEFLAHMRSNHQDLLDRVRSEGKLSDELDEELGKIVETFAKNFS